jgi:hypothetical protein
LLVAGEGVSQQQHNAALAIIEWSKSAHGLLADATRIVLETRRTAYRHIEVPAKADNDDTRDGCTHRPNLARSRTTNNGRLTGHIIDARHQIIKVVIK